MSLTTNLLIVLTVLATSTLSGVLGMAGGMILMAVLVLVMPVAPAMMLHGITQGVANGMRAWLLREQIIWRVLPGYLIGAAIAIAVFAFLTLLPDANLVLLLVGLFPWLGRMLPQFRDLDITQTSTAMVCGTLVTAAQLLAGASGPLLDVFYLNTNMTRHQVIATKALTQTIGHLIKITYYGVLFTAAAAVLNVPLVIACVAFAIIGTRLGTRLLDRLSDERFRKISGTVIQIIGLACVLKGAYGLTTAYL